MPEPDSDARVLNRKIDALESQGRRAAGLHGLYAATGLLIGLVLPVAQVRFNNDDTPETYTALGLVFSVNADYELDHPTWLVIAGLGLAVTVLTGLIAFLVAASRHDRTAATVALTASATLLPVLLLTQLMFTFIEIESGSEDDPLEGWLSGSWVLFLAGVAGCWIGAFLRDHFDR